MNFCRIFLPLVLVLSASGLPPSGAEAQTRRIADSQATERRTFSDEEILDGFFKVTLGAEMHSGGRVDRIRKFTTPVRIRVETRTGRDRVADVERIVRDIRSRIRGLDIAMAPPGTRANVTVHLVRDADLQAAILARYGERQGRRILEQLQPQCLSGFERDERYRIVRGDVFLVTDRGRFTLYDCGYEEILQVLGPMNDDNSIPWTMFNDDVDKGYFDIYDQYIMNILYHPLVRPGMTREEITAQSSRILSDVRAFVARRNGLGEAGARRR